MNVPRRPTGLSASVATPSAWTQDGHRGMIPPVAAVTAGEDAK